MRRSLLAGLVAASALVSGLAGPPADAAGTEPPLPRPGRPAHGWVAAVEISYSVPDDSREHLHLISPEGGTRVVGALPEFFTRVESVSEDAGHVVTRSPSGQRLLWDTAAGTSRVLDLPGAWPEPVPQGLLVRNDATGRVELHPYDGGPARVYPAVAGTSGVVTAEPGGKRFLETRSDGAVVVRLASSGKVVNEVRPPEDFASCSPVGGWDKTHFLARCSVKTSGGWFRSGTFAVKYRGRGPAQRVAPEGWTYAWPTTPRLVAMAPVRPATVKDGTVNPFPEDYGELIGAAGDYAYFLTISAPGSRALFRTGLSGGLDRQPWYGAGLYEYALVVDPVGAHPMR